MGTKEPYNTELFIFFSLSLIYVIIIFADANTTC